MKSPQKIHFIGIAGKGMSAVALMLAQIGWTVTGSDEGAYEPVSGDLTRAGIFFKTTYDAKNIPDDTDIIVIGKHAKLVPEENTEVAHAYASGKKILSFPQVIEMILEQKHSIVIAGSYGKSTCTALITKLLQSNRLDPSFLIGATTKDLGRSGYIGTDNYFILEGDEYPSANWDTTSKFMYYHPQTLLLTSCEHDHINIFPTIESYLEPYQKLLAKMVADDVVVCAIHHPYVADVIKNTSAKIVTYGLDDADWTARNVSYDKKTTFDLYHHETLMGTYVTTLLGEHNIENCVGALALCFEKNLITEESAIRALHAFHGLEGRIDKKECSGSIDVYEGFGSSYTKAKTVFDTLRLHFPKRQQICVFEPHTFSWRNRDALHWYKTVFTGVKHIILLHPPNHGATTHNQITGQEIVEYIKKHNVSAELASDSTQVCPLLEKILQPNDIVIMMTSGDLQGLRKTIPEFISGLNK